MHTLAGSTLIVPGTLKMTEFENIAFRTNPWILPYLFKLYYVFCLSKSFLHVSIYFWFPSWHQLLISKYLIAPWRNYLTFSDWVEPLVIKIETSVSTEEDEIRILYWLEPSVLIFSLLNPWREFRWLPKLLFSGGKFLTLGEGSDIAKSMGIDARTCFCLHSNTIPHSQNLNNFCSDCWFK